MSEPYFVTKAAARKAINPPHISLTSDSKGKVPPGAMLRYDGRLTTPSARLHIVKVFVGVQSHSALVRDSGQRENHSCTALADRFRVFSFDFIGFQAGASG
jgi:hypothetical protein